MNDNDESLKENSEGKSEAIIEEDSEKISDQENTTEEIKDYNQENEEFTFDAEIEEKQDEIIKEDLPEEEIDLNDTKEAIDDFATPTDETTEEFTESEKVGEESVERQMREVHKNLVEASLYAAGRPLTIEEISNKLEFPKKEVENLINEVAFEYLERSTALIIAQIGDRYQMQIRPEYTEEVSKFAKGGAIAERYLRSLTVIALKQPILKSTLIKLRGTGAYEHVKYLLDNGFIDATKKGRTHELSTTDKYADMFGLPKDKTELKRAMVTQLGIRDNGNPMPSSESEE